MKTLNELYEAVPPGKWQGVVFGSREIAEWATGAYNEYPAIKRLLNDAKALIDGYEWLLDKYAHDNAPVRDRIKKWRAERERLIGRV